MHRVALIVSHLILLASTSATGQVTGPLYAGQSAGPLVRSRVSWEAVDTSRRQIKPTYWKEGGVAGGVLGGVFVAALGYGLCTQSEGNTRHCGVQLLGGALLGAGAGFGLGALIGGQFPKHPAQAPTDSAQARDPDRR